jgi:rhomboid-related protein 1/2/3
MSSITELKLTPCNFDKIWTFVTYMFVHERVQHLILNVVIQMLFANPLELYHSWYRILLVYLSGVLSGSLGHSLFTKDSGLLGASAGVFALLSGNIVFILMNLKDKRLKSIKYIQIFLSLFLIMLEVIVIYYGGDEPSKVGHESHLFGGIGGILTGIYLLENFNENPGIKKISIVALVLYCVLTLAGFGLWYRKCTLST